MGTLLEVTQTSHRDVQMYFFSLRMVGNGMNLCEELVEAGPIRGFKNRFSRDHEAERK